VNGRIVNALTDAGVPAVGLTGVSGRLLPVKPAGNPPGSLGLVGEPTGARTRLLSTLLREGYTPVLAPVGTDQDGGVYNVNADVAAAAVAAALRAELLLVTDVPAVRDSEGHEIRSVGARDAEALLGSGVVTDGMIPKLTSAVRAVVGGARSAWIGSVDGLGGDGPSGSAGTRVVAARREPSVPLLPANARGVRA
jgi:acetylglutamate kinase